jgi:hypothetical protein
VIVAQQNLQNNQKIYEKLANYQLILANVEDHPKFIGLLRFFYSEDAHRLL